MRLPVRPLMSDILDQMCDSKAAAVWMDDKCMRDVTRPADWRCVVDDRLAEVAADFGMASPALGRAMA